jgi:hypothetical protein
MLVQERDSPRARIQTTQASKRAFVSDVDPVAPAVQFPGFTNGRLQTSERALIDDDGFGRPGFEVEACLAVLREQLLEFISSLLNPARQGTG